jgi:peroxiredoxin Q/BCP
MKLPHFSLPATDEKTYTHDDFQTGQFVIFVYPKDMTSGCTIEANEFQSLLLEFKKKNTKIFGLSKDPIKSHHKFCTKESLTYPLLSDEETIFLDALGIWKEKSMYGRKYMGAERSTFLIEDGKIIKEWHKVKAPGHAQEVFNFISTNQ